MLGSRAFRQSRSLSKLLRYLCSRAVIEDGDQATEYTIAVDVLGKPLEFKESKDASVRVEVHRLRKRLAEFYEQEGAAHLIHILIPTGQYVPQFVVNGHCSGALPAAHEEAPPALPHAADGSAELVHAGNGDRERAAEPDPSSATATGPHNRFWHLPESMRGRFAAAILILAALAAMLQLFVRDTDPLDSFWRPVFSSASPILLCVGNVEGGRHPRPISNILSTLSVLDFHNLPSKMMLVPDAATLARFAGLLQSKGKRYRIVSQSEATFDDLQSGPAVLIGLANNDWTERLVGKLRFSLEHRPPGKLIIRDSEHPGREDWSLDYSAPYLSITRDYALVVRVLDPKTEQMVVTAAGISSFGTLAAGEFLTQPQEFRKIEAVAPKGWQKRNFEIVLSTDVIRGQSGHPNIVAAQFW